MEYLFFLFSGREQVKMTKLNPGLCALLRQEWMCPVSFLERFLLSC